MGLARNAGLKKSSAQPTRPSSPTSTTKSAQNRHRLHVEECPLLGVKRTSQSKGVTSAFDPKQTSPSVRRSVRYVPIVRADTLCEQEAAIRAAIRDQMWRSGCNFIAGSGFSLLRAKRLPVSTL